MEERDTQLLEVDFVGDQEFTGVERKIGTLESTNYYDSLPLDPKRYQTFPRQTEQQEEGQQPQYQQQQQQQQQHQQQQMVPYSGQYYNDHVQNWLQNHPGPVMMLPQRLPAVGLGVSYLNVPMMQPYPPSVGKVAYQHIERIGRKSRGRKGRGRKKRGCGRCGSLPLMVTVTVLTIFIMAAVIFCLVIIKFS